MCIICKLSNNEASAWKVYEDDKYFAFLDIDPSAPGHTMVAPKKHVATLFDLSKQETSEIFELVKKIALHIKQSDLKPTGFNIGLNQWRAAGQKTDHLHIHIIPRWEDDGGSTLQSAIKNPKEQGLDEVLKKIKM